MRYMKKRIAAMLVLAVCMSIMMAIPASAAPTTQEIIKQTKPGVMKLFVVGYDDYGNIYRFIDEEGYICSAACVGSGFGIGKSGQTPEYIVTNWHVAACHLTEAILSDDMTAIIGFRQVAFPSNRVRVWVMLDNFTLSDVTGLPSEATAIECDIVYSVDGGYPDFAILKPRRPLKDFIALTMASAKDAEESDQVIALGCPGVIDDQSLKIGGNAITPAVGRVMRHMTMTSAGNTDVLLHDAQIAGGNSGGPLINMKGQVIGLNTYGIYEGNYAAAIYADYVMDQLDHMGIHYETGSKLPKLDSKVTILAVGAAVVAIAAVIFYSQKKPKVSRKVEQEEASGSNFVTSDASSTSGFQVKMPDGRVVSINKTKVLVGRGAECAVRFPENKTSISHHHCSLEDCGEYLVLADEGSRNGTFVHGKKIPDGKKVALRHGSSFTVGSEENRITVL